MNLSGNGHYNNLACSRPIVIRMITHRNLGMTLSSVLNGGHQGYELEVLAEKAETPSQV